MRREDLELGRQGTHELGVAAAGRLAIRSPPQEARCMAEAVALQVIVANLDDPLGTHSEPGEVACSGPAA